MSTSSTDDRFPPVTLDVTFAELYNLTTTATTTTAAAAAAAAATDGTNTTSTTHPLPIHAFACSDFTLTSRIPRNTKYLYQDSELVKPWSRADRERLARIVAIKQLALCGQRYAFASGGMPVVLLNPDVDVDGDGVRVAGRGCSGSDSDSDSAGMVVWSHAEAEVQRTFSVFRQGQRPLVRFCDGLDAVVMRFSSEKVIAALPFDGLDKCPQLLDPEVHYNLLSKGCLATSGLPTPNAKLIPLATNEAVLNMATRCPGFFPNEMQCFNEVEQDVFRAYVADVFADVKLELHARSLPFVLKFQQSSSGGGVHIVKTEAQRDKLFQKLQSWSLPYLLSSISNENVHLDPATLICTDFISASYNCGICLFVLQTGGYHFMSCASQYLDNEVFYTGSMIDYRAQDSLRRKFHTLLASTARFLSAKGYYGPVGLDVLEDAAGAQWIVDLNVRVSGDFPLGPLKGHFSERRDLHYGYIMLGMKFPFPRSDLKSRFAAEVEQGRIVVVAWYEELSASSEFCVSWANLAVGAETVQRLSRLRERISAVSVEVFGE